MNFGNEIKSIRLASKYSIDEFANKCGISTRHLMRLEKQEGNNTTLYTVLLIARAIESDEFSFIESNEKGKYVVTIKKYMS